MGLITIISMVADPRKIFGRLGNSLFQYAYIYARMKRGEIPDIFVQSPEYFDDCKEDIKKLYGEGIGYMPYVGVHLRVGGNPINPAEPRYMENPFYTNLANTGYYIKAKEHFKDFRFLVFSDDMDFARAYFEGYDFGFDDSANDIEAFNKLASCHHLIIANSSFSWWAAYLSGMSDKKVICPSEKSWFSDNIVRTRVPDDWIQIDP